jgi:hypothetical protein
MQAACEWGIITVAYRVRVYQAGKCGPRARR